MFDLVRNLPKIKGIRFKKENPKHVLTLQLTEISNRSKNQVDYN